MGIIVRNGILYGSGGDGGDDAFRYVNDESDVNFGWIQCQLEDGTWVNFECLGFPENYIIKDGKLGVDYTFKPMFHTNGSTVTQKDGVVEFYTTYSGSSGSVTPSFVCEQSIDCSLYSKLIVTIDASSVFPSGRTMYFDISNSNTANSASAIKTFSTTGTYELDLTNYNSTGYFWLATDKNGNFTLNITDIHFE